MIESVYFPKEGTGYIYRKPVEPTAPKKKDFKYESLDSKHKYVFDAEKYQKDLDQYNKERDFYEAHKDEYLCPASYYLIDHKFEFLPGKVNLIFGPNGCGKTTILKAIAGEYLCTDGFTRLAEPLDFHNWGEDRYSLKNVLDIIDKKKMNSAEIHSDGGVVYYHNFEHTLSRGFGEFGAMIGSILGNDLEEEVKYRMTSNKVSAGQNSVFLINKLISIIKSQKSLKDIVEHQFERSNEMWTNAREIQVEHFSKYEKYAEVCPITILLDEIDKSLDISTIWMLYNNALPTLCEKYGVQIICISHNPLVLTKTLRENKLYHFIDLNQDYTDEMMRMLSGVTF